MGAGFVYYGFGNLTNKTVLKGSGPPLSVVVDAGTNRISGANYDAAGNYTAWGALSYDAEGRMSGTANFGTLAQKAYGYDGQNRRAARWVGRPARW